MDLAGLTEGEGERGRSARALGKAAPRRVAELELPRTGVTRAIEAAPGDHPNQAERGDPCRAP